MAINITDDGSTVKLVIDSEYSQSTLNLPTIPAQTRFIEKNNLTVKAQGNQVELVDGTTKYSFLYSDITTPSGASASAVASLIEAFLDASSGIITVALNDGATSTTSNVASSATVVTLKAANTSRVKLVIVHDDTASTLYVKEGATASATDFTYKLTPGDTLIIDDYTGIVTGIWSAATGTARVTETV